MLKLISLNVERSKHLSRNLPFFLAEKPDVLCLQEVFEPDLERFQRELEMPFLVWLPDALIDHETNSTGRPGYSGQAILSHQPLTAIGREYYYMPERGIALQMKQIVDARSTNAQGIVWASLEKDGEIFTIANTHFTWTPDGESNLAQETDFVPLKAILTDLPPHILVGDLNAPRGQRMWEKFGTLYAEDGIPADTETTIDPHFHENKGLRLVVDALFLDSSYRVGSVRIVAGLSDHMAVVAEISRSRE